MHFEYKYCTRLQDPVLEHSPGETLRALREASLRFAFPVTERIYKFPNVAANGRGSRIFPRARARAVNKSCKKFAVSKQSERINGSAETNRTS